MHIHNTQTAPRKTAAKSESTQAPKYVDEFGLAEALGVSVHFLRKDRQTRRRIPFVRVGVKHIRYNLSAILAQIERDGGI